MWFSFESLKRLESSHSRGINVNKFTLAARLVICNTT